MNPSTDSRPNLKALSDQELTESFRAVSARERQATADLIEHIREFTQRRLYLDHGCTTIFQYMTTKLRYSASTAQNRIDAARMIDFVPALEFHLRTGEINLTQVSLLSQAVRQKEKENPDVVISAETKTRVLEKVRGLDIKQTAILVTRELDLNLKAIERLRMQKDESVILEVTLSREQMESLCRVKDLASHIIYDANWADVIAFSAKYYIEKEDPILQPTQTRRNSAQKFALEPASRVTISVIDRRHVFQRDRCCQWYDSSTGRVCGSTYQLQVDHIQSVSRGGGNEIENFQLLCGVHNRLKYQRERESNLTSRF